MAIANSLVGMEVREYIKLEHVGPVLRFLSRIVIVVLVVLLLDAIGLWLFLFFRGEWIIARFVELLVILLLFEGAIASAAGAFMFMGYSEYTVGRQGAINPMIARDQVRNWGKRRLSQQKSGVAMIIGGVLLIFLGLLISVLSSL